MSDINFYNLLSHYMLTIGQCQYKMLIFPTTFVILMLNYDEVSPAGRDTHEFGH